MTKTAILSDIHGNMDALLSVLSDARESGVTSYFVCGDITGYYYDTAGIWRILNEIGAVMCRGNHENILSDWIAANDSTKEELRKKYGSSFRIACEEMSQHELDSLIGLAHPVDVEIDGLRFLLSHGSPWSDCHYIYPDKIEENLSRLEEYLEKYDVVLMGHTHYQFLGIEMNCLIVNPGSVGQPRSGKEYGDGALSRAQWALYDTERRTCNLRTSFYNPSRILSQIERYDPDVPYLGKILHRQESAT